MHSISPYLLRCFNPTLPGKAEEKYSILDRVGQHDTFKLLSDFINSKSKEFEVIEDSKQVYKFENIKINDGKREIYGWLKAGSYGLKTDIINIKTGKVDFKKAQNNAEIIPHYFHFHIPKDFNEGIAILHSYRNIGIKTLFFDMFRTYFNTKTKLNLQMNPLSYDKALAAWQEANTKEIRVTRFIGMPDLADLVKGLGHKEQELTFKPPRKGALGKLKDYFDENSDQAKAVEILSSLGSQIKSVVEINGKKRTFVVGVNASNTVCQIELDDSVPITEGIPSLQGLYIWCSGVIEEYKINIYPTIKVA